MSYGSPNNQPGNFVQPPPPAYPTYDAYGQPIVNNPQTTTPIYVTAISSRQQLRQQNIAFIEAQLKNKYPAYVSYFTAAGFFILGLASLIIQFILTINVTPAMGQSVGFVSASFCFICVGNLIRLAISKTYKSYQICIIFIGFTIGIAIGFQVGFNVVALNDYVLCIPPFCSKTYTNLQDLNKAMIGLGSFISFTGIIFLIAIFNLLRVRNYQNFSNNNQNTVY